MSRFARRWSSDAAVDVGGMMIPCGFVHPRYGIANAAIRFPVEGDFARCFQLAFVVAGVTRRGFSVLQTPELYGSSFETDFESALKAAMGEAAERYCSRLYTESELILCEGETLGEQARFAETLIGFSDRTLAELECPYRRYSAARRMRWIRGVDLIDGAPVCLPAQAVIFQFPAAAEEQLYCNTTSGFAAGTTLDTATLSAALELIERDAFMSTWLLHGFTREVKLNIDESDGIMAAILRSHSVELKIRFVETDTGIPVIFAFLIGRRTGIITVGASCRLDTRSAVRKATLEAAHCRSFVMNALRRGESIDDPDEVSDFSQHALYCSPPQRRAALEFLLANPEPPIALTELYPRCLPQSGVGTSAAQLQYVVSRLRNIGKHVIVFDRTQPDVEALGITVVRAVVPGFQPLFAGHKWIPDDPRRLIEVATFANIPFSGEVNRDIHPFP